MRPASVYPLENYNSMSRVNQIKGKMLITGKIGSLEGIEEYLNSGQETNFRCIYPGT